MVGMQGADDCTRDLLTFIVQSAPYMVKEYYRLYLSYYEFMIEAIQISG